MNEWLEHERCVFKNYLWRTFCSAYMTSCPCCGVDRCYPDPSASSTPSTPTVTSRGHTGSSYPTSMLHAFQQPNEKYIRWQVFDRYFYEAATLWTSQFVFRADNLFETLATKRVLAWQHFARQFQCIKANGALQQFIQDPFIHSTISGSALLCRVITSSSHTCSFLCDLFDPNHPQCSITVTTQRLHQSFTVQCQVEFLKKGSSLENSWELEMTPT